MSRVSVQDKINTEESFFKRTERNKSNTDITPNMENQNISLKTKEATALIRQTYYITEEMKSALGLMSVKTNKDKSEIVRDMFSEYLKEYIEKLNMM